MPRWGLSFVKEGSLYLTDTTLGNSSTAKHGLAPKLSGNATEFLNGSGSWTTPSGGAGSANHSYYTYLAAGLEPFAIEPLQGGAFSYAINSSTTKLLLASYNTRIGASGRMENRDPVRFLPLRDVTVTGLGADATGLFIDPTLATYTDARTTYFDRLNTLATSSVKWLAVTAPSTTYPFLPGPYGTMIVNTTNFDFVWLIARYEGSATFGGWNIANEIGDGAASDYMRLANTCPIPVTRGTIATIVSGGERSAGVGKGGVAYITLPSSWGLVTDPNTYTFRDDMMGASLDTATTWTRSQSTAGNIEFHADFGGWCKVKGNSSWGANGARSQTTTARSAGKVFQIDVFTGTSGLNDTAGMVGWNDAGGNSYTNLAHAVNFTYSAGNILEVYEAGVSRGTVGSGYSTNTIYRVRITLGASNAAYAIQGGTQYGKIGSGTWTDITPGTTSNSTTPLGAGFTTFNAAGSQYVGDPKLY